MTMRNYIQTRKNAIVEYIDYQIPVTQREMAICKQQSEIKMRHLPVEICKQQSEIKIRHLPAVDMQVAKRD